MANRLKWESTDRQSSPAVFVPLKARIESQSPRVSLGQRFMSTLAHHRVGAPVATVIFAETLFRLLPNARLDPAASFVCAVSMLGLAGSIAAMGRRPWGARFARCWLWLLALCSLGFSFSNRTLYGIPAHQAAGLFFVGAVVCALLAESLRISSKRWAIIGEPALYWLAKPLQWTPGVVPREYRVLSRWTVKWDVAVGWLTIGVSLIWPALVVHYQGVQAGLLYFLAPAMICAIPVAIGVIRNSDAGRGFAAAGSGVLSLLWLVIFLIMQTNGLAGVPPVSHFLCAANLLSIYLAWRIALRFAAVVYSYRTPPKFQP